MNEKCPSCVYDANRPNPCNNTATCPHFPWWQMHIIGNVAGTKRARRFHDADAATLAAEQVNAVDGYHTQVIAPNGSIYTEYEV